MGIVARQSFWNSIFLYFGLGLAALNNVIIVPWVFTAHPEEEWGLIQYLLGIVLILSPIASLGLPNSIIRFMPYFRDKGKQEFFFLSSVIGTISFAVLALGLLGYFYFLRPEPASQTLTTRFMPYVLLLLLGNTSMNVFSSFARANYRTTFPTMVRELALRVATTIILLLYGFTGMNFETFFALFILINILQGLVMFMYVYRQGDFRLSRPFRYPARDLTRSILVFTFFSFLSGQTWAIIGKIDVILIKQLLDLKAVALYSIPFYAGTLISTPARAILTISYTVISDQWKENNLVKIQEFYRQTALNQLLISGFLFLALWLNIDAVLLVLGDKFGTVTAKWVFLFIGLGQLINSAGGNNSHIISASKDYRVHLYLQLGLIILTTLSQLYFIPRIGIIGAAVGAGLSIIVYNMAKVLFLQFRYRIHPFDHRYIYSVLLLCVPLAMMFADPYIPDLYVRVAVRMLVIFAVFFTGIYYFRISVELHTMLVRVLNRLGISRTRGEH